ncbi:heat shock protein 70 family protein [Skeletonema marinoi]|uniref:Heat shock protein 70 family protein n=1 Tax=Skeletonema marinoi TaxID=267567 RepID=A0AAD9D6D0_9STRA|nr:heat shock protein 70 family protein [Skeletonema marinoi]
MRRRRRKTDKQSKWSKELAKLEASTSTSSTHNKRIVKKKKKTKMTAKHQNDSQSGGMDALIPSLIGVVVLIVVVMAKMGFRGRATVAGIDLGTTNSVVCVQAPSSGVGEIVCIPDPATNSPVVPSVVSFLDNHHTRNFRTTKEEKEAAPLGMFPHPVDVVVVNHDSVKSLVGEVDYDIISNDESDGDASFSVPYHVPTEDATTITTSTPSSTNVTPSEIGSYIIHHLRTLTRNHLQHDNVHSAVIAIPAKFEPAQRDATIRAFELAGFKVARILEEPTAAALAYGLHKRDDVHYVMVYDFGGGTLDIVYSVAHWLLEQQGGEEIVKAVMASIDKIEASLNNDEEGVTLKTQYRNIARN